MHQTEAEKPKDDSGSSTAKSPPSLPKLALAAIGVVFGDIATSPLYAMQQAFGAGGITPRHDNVLGLLSLIFWALLLVVTGKYVLIVMRADNHGEGGMMALAALARESVRKHARIHSAVVLVGLAGAALFFGDSVITPAISVLSAVEGLQIASPGFEHLVLPIGAGVLVSLFLLQKRGSSLVGFLFGPIMTLWLLATAALGVLQLTRNPTVLIAANPTWAVEYLVHNGFKGFASLGSVILVMTGAEALYADIGHFGKGPIRISWFALALPALLVNYFGQGALLLDDAGAVKHPFFSMASGVVLYPIIVLATLATIIASQAVISGTFSMVRQGIQLGYLPHARVWHTSKEMEGQIYLPTVNALLFVAVMLAALGFRTSQHLAGAYGVAVSGTMMLTTVLMLVITGVRWRWSLWALLPFGLVYLCIDLALFAANVLKVPDGGWFPLVIAAALILVMTTWRRGSRVVRRRLHSEGMKVQEFVDEIVRNHTRRAPGTAVYLTGDIKWVPQALLQNLEHNHVVHKRNIILTVEGADQSHAPKDACKTENLGHGFWQVTMQFGFAEHIDVPSRLMEIDLEANTTLDELSWFVGHDDVEAGEDKLGNKFMPRWRSRLFAYLARNATPATTYYGIPPHRLIEIGERLQL